MDAESKPPFFTKGKGMRNFKISGFKRFLMLGLVFMINTFFGMNFSYGAIFYSGSCPTGVVACVTANDFLATFNSVSYVNAPGYGWMPATNNLRIGLMTTEIMLITNVAASPCAFFGKVGNYKANVIFMGCVTSVSGYQVGYCSMLSFTASESCTSSGSTTVNCTYGQYKNGNTCYNCPAGKYANVINTTTCVSCASGYYAAGTGNSKCTICAKGTYAGTAASKCTVCPSTMVYVGLSNGGIAGSIALGGTTAKSGIGAITGCYFAAMSVGQMVGSGLYFQGFYDPTGHVWDCNGVSMGYN